MVVNIKVFSRSLLLSFFTCFFLNSNANTPKNIYIWTGSNENVISPNSTMGRAHTEMQPLGYKFIQVSSLDHLKDPALIIACDVPVGQMQFLNQYPRSKLVLMTWEPPSVKPHNFDRDNHDYFSRVYTWHDGLVGTENYYKFYYSPLYPMVSNVVSFEEKKLCTLIAGNKKSNYPGELYSHRLAAINFFETYHPDEFDFYGYGWSNRRSYKGSMNDKIDVLRKYKFCICYENIQNLPGYVTEKIFDCFQAGVIPIYWGAPNVEDYIPKNCFISRTDFQTYEDLYEFMKNMTKETYLTYLQNIKEFLVSEKAQVYSQRSFIDLFKNMILEMTQAEKATNKRDRDQLPIEPHPAYKDFVIVIPSYNNAEFFEKNLESVFEQTYQNYRIIYIDDASIDGTGDLVEQYIKDLHQESRVTLIKNDHRVGALANTYKAISMAYPHEVVIILDGDDWLDNSFVLSYLNDVYSDSDVWMTYGQFKYIPSNRCGIAQPLPDNIIRENAFRSYPWVTSAPRTFYAALFHKIAKYDLLDDGIRFFKYAADLAYMFPMLEMAGRHSSFVGEILYDYNRLTPINDDKISRQAQVEAENKIRSKPKYKALDKLFLDRTQRRGNDDVNDHFKIGFFDSLAYILERSCKLEALDEIRRDSDWCRAQLLYDRYAREACQDKLCRLRIPKKIHQIWLGGALPERYKAFQQSWIKNHPDWEYKLWTDKDIEAFGLTNKEAYNKSKNYGQKSDIARYEILFREGGLYVDTDFECLKPFDIFHYCFDFYVGTGTGPEFLIHNCLIASAPGHPILAEAIRTLDISKRYHSDFHTNIQFTTGPYHLTRCYKSYASQHDDRVIAFPPGFFFPWPCDQKGHDLGTLQSCIRPETMGIHYWDVSWAK